MSRAGDAYTNMMQADKDTMHDLEDMAAEEREAERIAAIKMALQAAKRLLPNGYAIVPLDPTPGMLEQAAFNLCDGYPPERVKELGQFARDAYMEFVNAGMVR